MKFTLNPCTFPRNADYHDSADLGMCMNYISFSIKLKQVIMYLQLQ